MLDHEATKFFKEGWREYLRHLPEDVVHPIEVLVLRGHILIERQLNQLIELNVAAPKALGIERMRFSSKIRLAEALRGAKTQPWLWEALWGANKLRNSLAHKLEDSQLESHIVSFVNLVRRDDPLTFQIAGNELDSRLAFALSWLHERLLNENIRSKEG